MFYRRFAAYSTPVAALMGAAPPAEDSIAPNLDWRLPVLAAVSGNAQFQADSVAAGDGNKIWPKRSYTAGTYVELFQIDAVAEPGALLNWLVTAALTSITVEESFDSTDGSDGTWTALTVAFQNTGGSKTSYSHIVRIADGASRWIRMTNVMSGSGTLYVKFHQRSATGRDFIIGSVGSSKEASCWQAADVFNEIKRLEALGQIPTGSDPIHILYSTAAADAIEMAGNVGGANTKTGLLGSMIAAVPEMRYAMAGSMGAVDARTNYDAGKSYEWVAANEPTDLTNLRTGFHSFNLQCDAADIIPLHEGPDYRNAKSYAGFEVGGYAHPERGVLPYYLNDIVPVVQADSPLNYDSYRGLTKVVDYFSTAWRWWYTGSDGNHQTDVGSDVMRRERVIGFWNLLFSGTYTDTNLIDRTITAGLGAVGNAASSAFVDYGRPSVHSGSQYTITSATVASCSAFAYCNAQTGTSSNNFHIGHVSASRIRINTKNSGTTEGYQIGDTVNTDARTSTGRTGRRFIARTGNQKEYDYNGANVPGATATVSASTSATGNMCILRLDSTYCNDTIWLDGSGAYFDATERAAIDAIFVDLFNDLGVSGSVS